jgi:hypothetical protein
MSMLGLEAQYPALENARATVVGTFTDAPVMALPFGDQRFFAVLARPIECKADPASPESRLS